MTEQEIIDYLKENKTRGVAFAFMPSEVQKWCENNLLKTDIPFRKLGRSPSFEPLSWGKLSYDEPFYRECVYSLLDDYEPKFEPDWQEFEIDEDGYFYSPNGWRYYYNENVRFEVENAVKFKGFGGWLLDDHWYNCLPVSAKNESFPFIIASVTSINEQAKPMFPTKIRFWRRYRE